MSDKEQITNVIEGMVRAARDHDKAAVLANHSPEIVMFDVPPPATIRGMEDYAKTWDLFFDSHRPGTTFDVIDMDVSVDGSVAFAAGTIHCAGEAGKVGTTGFIVRLTVGLRKSAGRWQIVHEHHSVPAN